MEALDLRALDLGQGRAAKRLSFGPSTGEACFRALADPLRLHLGERGHDGQEDVAHQLVVGGEVLLGVGVEVDAVSLEPLQVADRPRHALPAEAVERPEEHQVELATRRACEKLREGLAVSLALGAALVLHVLVLELVPGALAPGAQLDKLVLRILPFVVGRHSGVDGDAA